MAHIHLIEGPVGAGKSTFGAQLGLKLGAPCLVLDDWMATLFSPDRPAEDFMGWYVERKDRCLEQIWRVAREICDRGGDVILELGLVYQGLRLPFLERLELEGYTYTLYILDAPRDLRWARVRHRNEAQGATFSMVVPEDIFEVASDAWEPPDEGECAGRDVRFFDTQTSLFTG